MPRLAPVLEYLGTAVSTFKLSPLDMLLLGSMVTEASQYKWNKCISPEKRQYLSRVYSTTKDVAEDYVDTFRENGFRPTTRNPTHLTDYTSRPLTAVGMEIAASTEESRRVQPTHVSRWLAKSPSKAHQMLHAVMTVAGVAARRTPDALSGCWARSSLGWPSCRRQRRA
jgi:hypothetical protein